MIDPKVSIIIPVYNVEDYLEKCLDSVINQTLKEIEIIIVNDCSPDNSERIILEYMKKDNRIKYIKHKKNLGAGGARNTGIKNATAKYIGSVDSDDWVDKDMFEKLYNAATDDDWDVVICGFKRVTPEGDILSETDFSNRSNIMEEKNKDIFTISNPSFCNKLWKKDLYIKNKVFFPDHLYYEDLATIPRVFYYTNKIAYLDITPYSYLWTRKDSASLTVSQKHIQDYFKVFDILKDFLYSNNCFIKYKESFYNQIYRSINLHLINTSNILNKKELQDYVGLFLKKLINWYKEDSKDRDRIYSKIKSPQKKTRIKFLLVQLSKEFGVYKILKRTYKFLESIPCLTRLSKPNS
jgi:glycosyltransferase involved in cell wall biosynthesis